jgi:nucleotide-binding universal stress UspA family protein
VTEGLFAEASVPVIVAHVDDDRTLKGPITVAVDGSPASAAALETGFAVAGAGQPIIIVHVVASDAEIPEASAMLEKAADRARATSHACERLTLRGAPAAAIVESAHQHGSAVIVMGTRGRSPVARWMLGSVAAGVIESAHVPVVVVTAK